MKINTTIKILMLGLLLYSVPAFSQDQVYLRKKHFNIDSDNLALKGYDPVEYFLSGKAVKGSSQHAVYYEGLIYRFSSVENKETFKKQPSRYEPAYGGWCAYAMGAKGEKVSIDPETFKILDGKLYLFYNRGFNNTLKSWNKNEVNLKKQGDVEWKKIFH